MNDLVWSLEMALFGMGTVFCMLSLLMLVLYLIGKLDTTEPGQPQAQIPESSALTIDDPSGLTPEEIAAIGVAVIRHAEIRQKQAAPYSRSFAPGSRLWASRWVAHGRAAQIQGSRRR